jgi:hypothetical protein
MSRITSIFSLLTGSALSVAPVDFRTALTLGADDTLIANITVTSSPGAPIIQGKLTDGDMYIVATNGAEEGPATLSFANAGNPSLVYDVEAPEAMYVFSPSSSYIGMGASSALVQQVGAVAVIKGISRRAELVLGSSMDVFMTTCAPGTLMTLSFAAGPIQITAKLGNGTTFEPFGDHRLEVNGDGSQAKVPGTMFDRIGAILTSQGSVVIPESFNRHFSRCSEAIMESLPTIDFTTPVGSIVYFPEDYVFFNPEDSTCKLRITRATDGAPLAFSPLLLVDTNVRITRDNQLNICESAATF